MHPAVPQQFPDDFSKELALFTAQLTENLEFLLVNGSLNIPPPLTFVANITGCPGCAIPVGINDEPEIPLGYAVLDPTTRTLYISYRGAVTSVDWQFAFNFNQTFYQQTFLLFSQGSSSAPTPELPSASPCPSDTKVHTGFFSLFKQIQADLQTVIVFNAASYDRIVFSGHSLGGAIASLSALYAAQSLTLKPVHVYTFGKPRLGDSGYRECILANLDNRFWRVENENDIINSLPLATSPDLQNPTQPFLYSQEGALRSYQLQYGSQTLNHSLASYFVGIASM